MDGGAGPLHAARGAPGCGPDGADVAGAVGLVLHNARLDWYGSSASSLASLPNIAVAIMRRCARRRRRGRGRAGRGGDFGTHSSLRLRSGASRLHRARTCDSSHLGCTSASDRREARRLIAAKVGSGARGAGAPTVASTIAVALGLDAAAAASRPPAGNCQLRLRSFPPPVRHLQNASVVEMQMCP